MLQSPKKKKRVFAAVVAVLMVLNFITLVTAYPETLVVDSGCCAPNELLAKDFSAFYTAAWRLFHDPSQVYTHGLVSDGEFQILPQPEGYKYLPSFLLMASPLLLLPYQSALLVFDLFQFLLLPLIALLLYELIKERRLELMIPALVAVLLVPLPLPTPQWSISISYYWQWAEGQSKVLDAFLLLAALQIAKTNKPRLAGVTLAFAAFDPRFALLAIPLFVTYSNSKTVRRSLAYAAVAFLLFNIPLFYPAMGIGFLKMVFTSGLPTPPYYYTFIPILAVSVLMLIDHEELGLAVKRFWPWALGQLASRPRT
jgi:Glycosyltransferase family 87